MPCCPLKISKALTSKANFVLFIKGIMWNDLQFGKVVINS